MTTGQNPNPTLNDVARLAGLSLSAASYALRGARNIPPATAERVKAAAKTLGYRANPRVTELMTHIRRGQPVARGERIAFIWSDAPWKERSFQPFFQGVQARAAELGYGIEEFWLEEPGMTPIRLANILRSRGITGLILSPLHYNSHFELGWDWSLFSAAILGNAACTPELHRAGHHHYLGMRMAMEKLMEQGCSRIAALLDPAINDRAKRAWSASFLEHHPERERSRAYLRFDSDPRKTHLLAWLKKIRADSLVCNSSTAHLLNPLGSSRTRGCRIVVLDRAPQETLWSGIDQGEEILGTQAVDLVAGQLTHNERGAPLHPKMLLFPGQWFD